MKKIVIWILCLLYCPLIYADKISDLEYQVTDLKYQLLGAEGEIRALQGQLQDVQEDMREVQGNITLIQTVTQVIIRALQKTKHLDLTKEFKKLAEEKLAEQKLAEEKEKLAEQEQVKQKTGRRTPPPPPPGFTKESIPYIPGQIPEGFKIKYIPPSPELLEILKNKKLSTPELLDVLENLSASERLDVLKDLLEIPGPSTEQ